jgi:hypothetical protein
MAAQIELTNNNLSAANGQTIPDHKLSVRRTLLVLDDGPVFIDTIIIHNYADDPIVVPVSLEFSTTFKSMFVLRGAPEGERGSCRRPLGMGPRYGSATTAPTACNARCSLTSR